jgi:hypothetical protein
LENHTVEPMFGQETRKQQSNCSLTQIPAIQSRNLFTFLGSQTSHSPQKLTILAGNGSDSVKVSIVVQCTFRCTENRDFDGSEQMPIEIDPNWEYYTCDPDLEYLLESDGHTFPQRQINKGFEVVHRVPGRGISLRRCKDTFILMWLQGFSYTQIMNVLGVKHFNTLRLWREKLKLPLRMSGNHPRQKQIDYMKSQEK